MPGPFAATWAFLRKTGLVFLSCSRKLKFLSQPGVRQAVTPSFIEEALFGEQLSGLSQRAAEDINPDDDPHRKRSMRQLAWPGRDEISGG
jgi:hypothetical protein